VIVGDYLMDHFDTGLIHQMLDLMTPDNMRIQLIAPGVTTDRKAKWYDTPYQVSPIEPLWLRRWQHPQPLPAALTLPEPNLFICDRPNPESQR